MSPKHLITWLILHTLCFILFITGCGYKPFPTFREDIENIYIPTFKNSTYHPGISGEVTDALRREIILDGTFRLTDRQEADAILSGEVVDFERLPLLYDEEENVIGGRVKIKIEVHLLSLPTEEMLWQEDIQESEWVNYFLAGTLAKREEELIRFVAEKVARRIVERITEPW